MTLDEAEAALASVVDRLGEQFEAIQILVSWNEEGETNCVKHGCGNWYARQGMAREFLQEEAAQVQAQKIVEATQNED